MASNVYLRIFIKSSQVPRWTDSSILCFPNTVGFFISFLSVQTQNIFKLTSLVHFTCTCVVFGFWLESFLVWIVFFILSCLIRILSFYNCFLLLRGWYLWTFFYLSGQNCTDQTDLVMSFPDCTIGLGYLQYFLRWVWSVNVLVRLLQWAGRGYHQN